jgi:hypothetical protein
MQLLIACDAADVKLGDEVFITVGSFKTVDGRPLPNGNLGANVGFVRKITPGSSDATVLAEIGY